MECADLSALFCNPSVPKFRDAISRGFETTDYTNKFLLLPPISKRTPQSLLQSIESFDRVFLFQVTAFGDDWLTAYHDLANRGAR